MHPGVWERLADMLFWLQLCWIFSGFLLMAYLAFKVFPDSGNSSTSQTGSVSVTPPKRELIVLGGYRFEVTQDSHAHRPNVVEFATGPVGPQSAGARISRHSTP